MASTRIKLLPGTEIAIDICDYDGIEEANTAVALEVGRELQALVLRALFLSFEAPLVSSGLVVSCGLYFGSGTVISASSSLKASTPSLSYT